VLHTRSTGSLRLGGREIINLALLLSFPVVALDQFLRTPPAQLSAQPVSQVQHWVTDSLMMLPLFALGVWAGDRIAHRAGLGQADSPAVFKRALVIAGCVAVALIPVWYERNKTDTLVQTQALVTPHSHGSVDVYWVGSGVIMALVCVCLIPAAAWLSRVVTSPRTTRPPSGRRPPLDPRPPHTPLRTRLPHATSAAVRVPVVVLLVAAGPMLAWLLHQVALHAYASQVDYTSALQLVPVHSHAYFGGHGPHSPGGPSVKAAPFAFGYQIAHALQDGLAGQAAGLPVAFVALLWGARGLRLTPASGRYQQAET